MMNKIKTKKILMLIPLMGMVLYSCVDLEEVTPGKLTTETLYKTQADMESAAVGLYYPLFGGYRSFDFDWPIVMTAGAEDVSSQAGIFAPFDQLRVKPGSGALSTMWESLYKSINNASNIIGNIDNVPETVERNNVEGQARFIRAMSYFYLVRWFGEVQLITYENQSNTADVEQSTMSAIYNLIENDLEIAELLLPVDIGVQPVIPNKIAAKALLAKVYLTMAGYPLNLGKEYYTLAKNKTEELIYGEFAGLYSLEPDFASLWDGNNKLSTSEFIFILHGLAANSNNASHHHISSRPPTDGGWGDWYTEERFLNSFPEGPRKDASFRLVFSDGSHWSENNVPGGAPGQPFTAKYRNPGGDCGQEDVGCPEHGDGFFPVLRYADVLLMYAEAANKSEGSPSANAYEALNKVRRRAAGIDPNTPDLTIDLIGLSSEDFDKEVLDERNWELAFEGNRWFDLVRRDLVIEVNEGYHDNITMDDYFMPKPDLQVSLSPGLHQNSGY